MRAVTRIELFFNGLADGHVIQIPQDKQGLDKLPKDFKATVQSMLMGIGVHSANQVRRGGSLQFDRRDEMYEKVPSICPKLEPRSAKRGEAETRCLIYDQQPPPPQSSR